MKGDQVYNFMIGLVIFIAADMIVALINQFYVPYDGTKYEELTFIQKILYSLRFYFNIVQIILVTYTLYFYSKYLNYLTILLIVLVWLASARYFLFALKLIYYFINKTEKNDIIIEFIEGTLGKVMNSGILILLIYLIIKIYFLKSY